MTLDEYKELAQKDFKEAVAYDFKEEAFDSIKDGAEDFLKIGDPIERFLIYRSVRLAGRKSDYAEGKKLARDNLKKYAAFKGFDCDKAHLTMAIEAALWPNQTLATSSDTMSSALTTLNRFVKTILLKTMFSVENHDGFDKEKSGLKGNVSLKYCLYLYAKQEFDFLGQIKKYADENKSGIYNFFQCVHTIGNFIPVPSKTDGNGQSFNTKRESCYAQDYWDRTLYCIYQWYKWYEKDHMEAELWLEKLLLAKEKIGKGADCIIVNACKDWLKSFQDEKKNPSWDVFVEENYLQDYTEWTTKPYGRPKEFWVGHFSGKVFPQTPEQFEAFFAHATEAIKARSKRMVEAL